MNIFQQIFDLLVYKPQLNLLYWLFLQTHDVGIAIVLLALVVNLALWPIFAKSYINLQKTRIFQPKLKEIQQKYKDNPQEGMQKIMEFNKKHGINNSSTFLVLFAQLFFVSGLFFVIRDVSAQPTISGLYQGFFSTVEARFNPVAFRLLHIGSPSTESFLSFSLPIISFILSYFYGLYTFKWAPKLELPAVKKETKSENDLNQEAIMKTQEFMGIYFTPILLFVMQISSPTGLNIYFATTSLLALLRQIFVTQFYSSHTDKLLQDIAQSDPEIQDVRFDKKEVDPDLLDDEAVATAMIKKKDNQEKSIKKVKKKSKSKK